MNIVVVVLAILAYFILGLLAALLFFLVAGVAVLRAQEKLKKDPWKDHDQLGTLELEIRWPYFLIWPVIFPILTWSFMVKLAKMTS